MSLSDESLFREVDEEVRRQKLQDLWNRWGNVFIAISVAVILLVAGYKGWQYWEQRQAEQAARDYFAAVTFARRASPRRPPGNLPSSLPAAIKAMPRSPA